MADRGWVRDAARRLSQASEGALDELMATLASDDPWPEGMQALGREIFSRCCSSSDGESLPIMRLLSLSTNWSPRLDDPHAAPFLLEVAINSAVRDVRCASESPRTCLVAFPLDRGAPFRLARSPPPPPPCYSSFDVLLFDPAQWDIMVRLYRQGCALVGDEASRFDAALGVGAYDALKVLAELKRQEEASASLFEDEEEIVVDSE